MFCCYASLLFSSLLAVLPVLAVLLVYASGVSRSCSF